MFMCFLVYIVADCKFVNVCVCVVDALIMLYNYTCIYF